MAGFPFLNAPSVSPDGSKVAIYYNYSEKKLGIYDLKSGKQLHLHNLSQIISRTLGIYFQIDPAWKFCAFTNQSNGLTLIDLATGAIKCEIYNTGPLDFAIHTPEGYYMATRMGASHGVAFEKDGQLYDFDQFDLQFNKPDVVLAKVGQTPPAMVEAMKKARLKRLRLLGYEKEPDNFDLHVPVVELTGDLPPFTEKSTLNLSISAADSKEFLDRVMVYVNGVPLMGNNGFSIKNQQLKKYNKTIAVPLVAGDNIIEVEAYNVKGSRSLRAQQTVRCEIPVAKPDLYLVAIGVSTYADADKNLRYAAKDAKDLIDLFTQKNKFYNKINTLNILEGDFSKAAFQKIKQALAQSQEKDHIIVFFAGHGLVDSALDYYLGTTNVDFNNPAQNGIAYTDIENLFEGIPARHRLLLLDACFSGEIDKETAVLIQKENTQAGPITFRSSDQGLVAGNTEAERVYNLMRRWFVDLRAATGATVLTSSTGLEFSREGEQWKNGVFTWCLLNGLRDGKADKNKDGQVMISELRDYLAEEVPKLTSGGQRPTFRVENLLKDWRVW
ncbi:MAG: caspase family protein [Saprospiraceae bacterium]|nr:caspase family protein [Saprospiraceae bacterium]